MKELSIETQQSLVNVITEKPVSFTLKGKRYALYYPSLGKVLLVQNELSECKGSFSDIPTLCQSQRWLCCRILALNALCNRKQMFNTPLVETIAKEFDDGLQFDDLCRLMFLVKMLNDTKELEKALGMNDDDAMRQKVSATKNEDSNSMVFGGKTIYGNLIDAACQRYGWTLDYLLWDVSYANVHFMMKDAISSVYVSEEDRKKLHIAGGETIDANDPANAERIKQLLED